MNTFHHIIDLCIILSALSLTLLSFLPLLFKGIICLQKFPSKVRQCRADKRQALYRQAVAREFDALMKHPYHDLKKYVRHLALPTDDMKKPTIAWAIANYHVQSYGL